MKHELRVTSLIYARLADGSKTFSLEDNDKGFQFGDTVEFKEFDISPLNPTSNAPKGFTEAKPLVFKVGYVQVLDSSRVILSLIPIKKSKS